MIGAHAATPRRTSLAALIGLLLLMAASLQAQEKSIVTLELRGLERNDNTVVLSKIQSKEGRPYSKDTIDNDVRRLFATGLFADIDVRDEPVEGGVKLIFTFQENDILEDIVFLGLKSLKEKEIKKDLRLQIGDIYNYFFLKQDIESMRDKYLEKGYPFVEIEPKTRTGQAGVVLEYIIREGPEVTVDEIHFEGNRGIDTGDIKDVMETHSSSLFSHKPYVERKLKNDLVRIKKYYRSEGYLDAAVYLEDVKFNDTKEKVTIIIRLEEGTRYRIKGITLEGNTLFLSEDVLKELKTKPGDFYVGNQLDKDVGKVRDMYGEKAYINSDVNIDLPIAEEKGYVNLVLTVKEGTKSWVDKLRIQGNSKTKDYVMRRAIGVYPGEEMNMVALKRSMKRLESSGYFETAGLRWEEGRDEEHKNIIIDVTEGSTGAIRFGGGFSSNFGFLGLLELTQRNFDITRLPKSLGDLFSGNAFAGAGQFFRATYQPGEKRSRWGLDFKEPWFFGHPLAFSTSLYGFTKDRTFFTEGRLGASVGFDKRFEDALDGLSAGIGYRIEKIDVFDVKKDAPQSVQDVQGTSYLSAISPHVAYDQRDSGIFPTKGYIISWNHEIAGGPFGGDYNYYKTTVDFNKFFTILTTESGGKHVLVCSANAGYATAIAGGQGVPTFEKFFGGGTGTVRGFQYRTISPKVDGDPVGGDAEFFASSEYSFPIYRTTVNQQEQDILRGALFVDAGNVQRSFADMDMEGLRVGAGFGLRFSIPQLGSVPVALDFGFPLKKQADDITQFVFLNLGYNY